MENTKCIHCKTENKPTFKYCSNCGYELPRPIKVEGIEEPKVVVTKNKTVKKSKKQISIIAGLIVALVVMWGVQQLFFSSFLIDKVMQQTASEVNKSCPFMVDAETRLDNAIALPGKVLQYNYTLVNLAKDQINIEDIKKAVEPIVINNLKTNPDMKYYRDNEATIKYAYKDKNGVFIYSFAVTPDMLK